MNRLCRITSSARDNGGEEHELANEFAHSRSSMPYRRFERLRHSQLQPLSCSFVLCPAPCFALVLGLFVGNLFLRARHALARSPWFSSEEVNAGCK